MESVNLERMLGDIVILTACNPLLSINSDWEGVVVDFIDAARLTYPKNLDWGEYIHSFEKARDSNLRFIDHNTETLYVAKAREQIKGLIFEDVQEVKRVVTEKFSRCKLEIDYIYVSKGLL